MPDTITLPCKAALTGTARAAARALLTGTPVAEDVELIVSELFANAVLWSRSAPDGAVEVVIDLDPGARSVRVEVHDDGPAADRRPQPLDPDQHGRGLMIVDRLTKDWGHIMRSGRETYWAVLTWDEPTDTSREGSCTPADS